MKTLQLILPINTEILIPADDSVRLLDEILETLNYQQLYSSYSTLGRKPNLSPKTQFKILVYAYMNNIYSSRKIEKACKRDINFMWLLNGQKAPDHNTIARFRNSRISHVLEDLFNQFIIKLGALKEIKYENIFIDGSKIEANANKYTFVWKKATTKFNNKLKEKIKTFLEEVNKDYCKSYLIKNDIVEISLLEEILEFLHLEIYQKQIQFVFGKGKRKHKLQKSVELLQEFIEKQKKYDYYNKTFDGRNSFSKTDTDATFMKMKDDHMKNSQLKPGYNVQIGVEGEYIVGVDISSERSDQLTLIPFLDKLNKNLPEKYKSIVADAGYESEENYVYLESNKQKAYIKPSLYESMKKNTFKKKIGKKENMQYIKESDEYICNNNKKLKFKHFKTRESKSGYISTVKVYECESCKDCKLKSKCTKAKENRKIHVSPNFEKKRKQSLENITSAKGVILRMNRSIQVEGAFGILKEDYGFRRFLTRGKSKVKTEIQLLSLAYNINKLHNKKIKNRCGVMLHKEDIA